MRRRRGWRRPHGYPHARSAIDVCEGHRAGHARRCTVRRGTCSGTSEPWRAVAWAQPIPCAAPGCWRSPAVCRFICLATRNESMPMHACSHHPHAHSPSSRVCWAIADHRAAAFVILTSRCLVLAQAVRALTPTPTKMGGVARRSPHPGSQALAAAWPLGLLQHARRGRARRIPLQEIVAAPPQTRLLSSKSHKARKNREKDSRGNSGGQKAKGTLKGDSVREVNLRRAESTVHWSCGQTLSTLPSKARRTRFTHAFSASHVCTQTLPKFR